jgi:hypothetical protein
MIRLKACSSFESDLSVDSLAVAWLQVKVNGPEGE